MREKLSKNSRIYAVSLLFMSLSLGAQVHTEGRSILVNKAYNCWLQTLC